MPHTGPVPTTTSCPTCGRPGVRQAFSTTKNYVACVLGHVFPAAHTTITTTEEV